MNYELHRTIAGIAGIATSQRRSRPRVARGGPVLLLRIDWSAETAGSRFLVAARSSEGSAGAIQEIVGSGGLR